jgi:hypothetical protein
MPANCLTLSIHICCNRYYAKGPEINNDVKSLLKSASFVQELKLGTVSPAQSVICI